MTNLDLYLFPVLVVLVGYLFWSLGRVPRKSSEPEPAGKGFEAACISPQIKHLRQNYASLARAHRAFPCGRRQRLAIARAAVSHLSFFNNLQGMDTDSTVRSPSESAKD